jgi:hypothetical protein
MLASGDHEGPGHERVAALSPEEETVDLSRRRASGGRRVATRLEHQVNTER